MANLGIQSCYNSCIKFLEKNKFEDAQLTILFVFEYVLNDKYIKLLADNYVLSTNEYQRIFDILNRCLNNEPLAYILGEAYFRSNRYFVEPGVLIPRPETEELVDYSASIINYLFQQNKAMHVYECGLGSGIISIELAALFPNLKFTGWDISETAIRTTLKNKDAHNIRNLQVYGGNFLEQFETYAREGDLQLVVSNPPYVSENAYNSLDERLKHEPREALVADNDGLSIIISLVEMACEYLFILICEIGFDQQHKLTSTFNDIDFVFRQDLSGNDRFLFYFPPCILEKYAGLLSTLSN